MICRYMTLSPASADSLAWKGAYFACQQLHQDMRDVLKPEQDLAKYIVGHHASQAQTCCQSVIMLGLPCPQLDLIRELTIHTAIPYRAQGCWDNALLPLYALYLDHLHVILTGAYFCRLPYGDLKSWHSELFVQYAVDRKVNCKKVTFTIAGLANMVGGKVKSTEFENTVPGANMSYFLNIVEDKTERQTERAYSSEVRFKARRLND
ncbi:hypothetical protein N0V83_000329 [Neocucurbitaria cava]|uniref:Uncharacterized protein n=1 Tax=Neocucurbitaria cava TaxID=798079 RepID=A0A9W8YGG3_9PLEO|nr:hypothetical protein N0V83_000329 [Neocucurbitaria cava]